MGSPEVGCGQVLAYLWRYLDQEVDHGTCAKLDAHLTWCESCRQAVEFDRRFKQVVRRCADAEPIAPDRLHALVVRVRYRIECSPPPSE